MPKKSSNRDDFNLKVIEMVAKRASYICSNPDCRANTIAPSDSDPNKIQYIGIASHITAASPGGPRYDSALSPEERKSINNAIFLCSSCATMIDKNKGIDYPADLLRKWKNEHENWIKENLNKRSDKPEENPLLKRTFKEYYNSVIKLFDIMKTDIKVPDEYSTHFMFVKKNIINDIDWNLHYAQVNKLKEKIENLRGLKIESEYVIRKYTYDKFIEQITFQQIQEDIWRQLEAQLIAGGCGAIGGALGYWMGPKGVYVLSKVGYFLGYFGATYVQGLLGKSEAEAYLESVNLIGDVETKTLSGRKWTDNFIGGAMTSALFGNTEGIFAPFRKVTDTHEYLGEVILSPSKDGWNINDWRTDPITGKCRNIALDYSLQTRPYADFSDFSDERLTDFLDTEFSGWKKEPEIKYLKNSIGYLEAQIYQKTKNKFEIFDTLVPYLMEGVPIFDFGYTKNSMPLPEFYINQPILVLSAQYSNTVDQEDYHEIWKVYEKGDSTVKLIPSKYAGKYSCEIASIEAYVVRSGTSVSYSLGKLSKKEYDFDYETGKIAFNQNCSDYFDSQIDLRECDFIALRIYVEKYQSIEDFKTDDGSRIAAMQTIHASILEYFYQFNLATDVQQKLNELAYTVLVTFISTALLSPKAVLGEIFEEVIIDPYASSFATSLSAELGADETTQMFYSILAESLVEPLFGLGPNYFRSQRQFTNKLKQSNLISDEMTWSQRHQLKHEIKQQQKEATKLYYEKMTRKEKLKEGLGSLKYFASVLFASPFVGPTIGIGINVMSNIYRKASLNKKQALKPIVNTLINQLDEDKYVIYSKAIDSMASSVSLLNLLHTYKVSQDQIPVATIELWEQTALMLPHEYMGVGDPLLMAMGTPNNLDGMVNNPDQNRDLESQQSIKNQVLEYLGENQNRKTQNLDDNVQGHFMKHERMEYIKEILDYLSQFKEAERIGDKGLKELSRMGVNKYNFLRKLDLLLKLPSSFEFNDIGYKLDNKEDLKQYVECIQQAKADYEKIPEKYRGEDSPRVQFYDRVTDYPNLEQSLSRSYQNEAELREALDDAYTADGYYDPFDNVIVIATNKEILKTTIDPNRAMAHEMGHYIYYSNELQNSEEWTSLFNELKREDLIETGDIDRRDTPNEAKSELFANAILEYYTGKVRGKRAIYNFAKWVKKNQYLGEGGEVSRIDGLLDDYPIILDFLIEKLGVDGAYRNINSND